MSENGPQRGDQVAVQMNGHSEQMKERKAGRKKKFTLGSIFRLGSKGKDGGSGQNDIDLAKEVNFTEHLMTLGQLEEKFQTSLDNGLSAKEAEFRFQRDGPNAFTPPKQTPNWLILLKELTGGFAWIMWLAAAGSLAAYFLEGKAEDYILTIVLVATIFITGLWSFKEQRTSGKLFDTFKNMIPQETLVIREGKQHKVPADRLVVGDVVLCKGGERIPADVRILKCEGMKVDNSSLTGEAEPLSRSPEAGHQMPLEAKNIAFFSTSCVDGSGVGLVIATGDNTVMGKIAKLVTNIQAVDSPISIEVSRFVRFIACLGISLGVIFCAVCMGLQMPFFAAFVNGIAIIVGNIPEGLLPAMTLALTLTAKRLAQKNCMIKYLEAVETLGSTSTICSDKTGTLTENRMTVEHCYLGNQIVHASHEEGETREDMAHLPVCWQAFQRCAKLCSRANFIGDSADILSRECSGDASESAILRFMECVSLPETVMQYRDRFPKLAEKPFSSVYKYQYSVHRNTEKTGDKDAEFFVVMKGAPERVVKLCSTILNDRGETVPMSDDDIDAFEFAYRELGSMGERVLAFCDMDLGGFAPDHQFNLDEGNDFEVKNMRFLGLIAMIDPPRGSVPGAVAKCKDAGICVIMVTGDHPITAQAIAKSVGIISVSHRRSTQISLPKIDRKFSRRNAASIVVPGDELANIDDDELRDILRDFNEIVFARTSPQQKLRIVDNCQSLGRIVAVTGDGVNDSPALKKADIGIAMGITGSDVSKQAADMILLDDNFASIVVGVEEGRKIFDNMKKTISYILAGNCATIYPFLVFLILGIPVTVTPIMILCICLGTDLIPAISLAYEKAESDIMKLQPRNPQKDHLVTRNLLLWSYLQAGIIVTASGYLGFFLRLSQDGFMPWHMMVRNEWLEESIIFTNQWDEPYDLEARKKLLAEAQSAYFCCIIVVQWMDVIINKTRRVSIFSQGFGNWFLNFSIFAETVVACILLYVPKLNSTLTFTPVGFRSWLAGVPFFVFLLAYEEGRKYIVRNYPKSFLGQELAR